MPTSDETNWWHNLVPQNDYNVMTNVDDVVQKQIHSTKWWQKSMSQRVKLYWWNKVMSQIDNTEWWHKVMSQSDETKWWQKSITQRMTQIIYMKKWFWHILVTHINETNWCHKMKKRWQKVMTKNDDKSDEKSVDTSWWHKLMT